MDQLAAFLKTIKPRYDDDTVDRLNYYYTVVIMLAFAITLSAKQYVGQPLQCWVPAEFTGSWEKYAEDYCYIENTYFVEMENQLPDASKTREQMEISYYQWVPFVLALQALMFHIPHLLWQLLNWQSGLNVRAIVSMACDTKNVGQKERGESVTIISRHIEDACGLQKNFGRETNPLVFIFGFGKAKGLYVTGLYIACKVLYVVNAVGQMFLLNSFIGSKYTFWGAEIVNDVIRGRTWENSGHFPRVTMCDFMVRALGTTRSYSVQCVLMINMFNEKIYLFLWWWLLLVAIMNLFNMFWWLYVSFSAGSRVGFVEKYIRTAHELSVNKSFKLSTDEMRRFVRSRLRPDGVFVLRLVSANAGDVISTDIVKSMWLQYLEDRNSHRQDAPHSPNSSLGSTESATDSTKPLVP